MKAVTVRHLQKNYNGVEALKDVSFDVEEGEIFGVIGPDGAGKSTLFRILTTLILPSDGEVLLNGMDVVDDYKTIRKHIGYMPGKFSLYQDLSVEENLEFFATIFGTSIAENYALVEDVYRQIEPFKYRKAGALSGGMKQKLALCCALIHKPTVLILDEPTTGVDPVSRKEFWEMLKKLKTEGIAILVSTPYMDEASLCDRIALIADGEILTIDPPKTIISEFGKRLWAVKSDQKFTLLNNLRENKNIASAFAFGENIHVTLTDETYSSTDLNAALTALGHRDISIRAIEASIEDCFMDLGMNKIEHR